MDGMTEYRMLLVSDRLAGLREEAATDRLLATNRTPSLRARIGSGLVRLGRAIAPEATPAGPRLGEPARFPRAARPDERVDLGRAA
jgi:hypothetical protein